MAYASITYTGNGATTNFSVTFPYILQAHVLVYVANVLKTVGVDYTWLNATTIQFTAAPANAAAVLIKRSSGPAARLVDFTDASTLTEADLDRQFDQDFYIAQEAFDALANVLGLANDNTWDAASKRIKNVADPVNPQDAATKNYVVAQLPADATAAAAAAAASATAAATNAGLAAAAAVTAATAQTNAGNSATAAATYAGRLHGQCKLQYISAGIARLDRWDGSTITIDGVVRTIPQAGVSLTSATLPVDNTTYYVYAYWTGSAVALEVSATSSAFDATYGTVVKAGDSTRTLVGLVRKSAGNFRASFVRSWFNDRGIAVTGAFTTTRAVSSGSFAEAHTEIRCEFLMWAGESIDAEFRGSAQNTNGTAVAGAAAISIDGNTAEAGQAYNSIAAGAAANMACGMTKTGVTEGYHYVTLMGLVSGTSYTFYGPGTGSGSLSVLVR